MAFWAAYHSSKRPSEVEEPSDWIQRPVGYVIARLALPTPLTPNGLTVMAMLLAIAGGVTLVTGFRFHAQVAGLLLLLSAIFDASDGQLARMRGTQSANGRMLDGAADLVGAVAAVAGSTWPMFMRYGSPWWLGALLLIACAVAAVTGSFHTALYDHYKNVWMRLMYPGRGEGEDYETALSRFRNRSPDEGWVKSTAWRIYLVYVKSQIATVRGYDPYTPLRVQDLRSNPALAEIYRREARRALNVWRTFFGFGTVVVGIALFAALEHLEIYLLARVFLLNALFYGWLRTEQRRASRLTFGAAPSSSTPGAQSRARVG